MAANSWRGNWARAGGEVRRHPSHLTINQIFAHLTVSGGRMHVHDAPPRLRVWVKGGRSWHRSAWRVRWQAAGLLTLCACACGRWSGQGKFWLKLHNPVTSSYKVGAHCFG
jgi:hypothetical protein